MVGDAVSEHGLAVADGLDVLGSGEECASRHGEEERVLTGHGAEDGVEAEVLRERGSLGRELAAGDEVAFAVHEERLHRARRSFRRSYVRSYFSATASAYAIPEGGRRSTL